MKTGFIGAGNMAGAIIKGMAASGKYPMNDVYVFDVDGAKVGSLSKQFGITPAGKATDLIEACGAVIFAVKPNVLEVVINQLKNELEEKKPLIVSIAVGKTIHQISGFLGYRTRRIVRVMPNINAKVLGAMSALCAGEEATAEDIETVNGIFGCIGKTVMLEEKKFSAFAAISASSPAFSYLYIDALARAGVKHGMSKDEALRIAAQSVLGSAKMILESGEHPCALADQVCSPAGTTIEGVVSLRSDAFEASVIKAIDAVIEKDKKM